MSQSFEQGREAIASLCDYFATNRQKFFDAGVKEAHVRQTLIDPLFEALGWDVRNRAMIAPQYREVIPEDSLDVEGQQKAPDYAFRVGTLPKFYAEAKKCGVNIAADMAAAFQLRRYGWSAEGRVVAPDQLRGNRASTIARVVPRRTTRRAAPEFYFCISRNTPTAGASCGTYFRARRSGPGLSMNMRRPNENAARPRSMSSF